MLEQTLRFEKEGPYEQLPSLDARFLNNGPNLRSASLAIVEGGCNMLVYRRHSFASDLAALPAGKVRSSYQPFRPHLHCLTFLRKVIMAVIVNTADVGHAVTLQAIADFA